MGVRPIDRNQAVVDSKGRPTQNLQIFCDQVKKAIDYFTIPELTISSLDDLPAPSGGVITIANDICLNIVSHINLQGNRIVCSGICVIKGSNAETASITSSLASGAMIYSESILQLRDITLSTGSGAYCVEVDGTGNPDAVADWFAVNFTGGKSAKLTSLGNVICILMGMLSPDNGIEFYGTFGTIAYSETILSLSGAGKTAIKFDASVVITRRVRFSFCAFVVSSSAVGIDMPLTVTIPDDTYILFFCNFAGGGTYTSGYTYTSLKSRWYENRGISNTYRAAEYYVENNATATIIGGAGTYVKLAGTTTALAANSGFSHTNNRLTCTSVVSKLYSVKAIVTFTSTAGNIIAIKIYKNGSEILGSKVRTTANAAGREENVSSFGFTELALNDYVEIWVTNETAANNVVGVDYSLLVTEK